MNVTQDTSELELAIRGDISHFSISAFDLLVATMLQSASPVPHASGQNQSRKAADALLSAFRSLPDAWCRSVLVLQHSTSFQSQLVATQIGDLGLYPKLGLAASLSAHSLS